MLEGLKVRYTQASALNDPFESLPAIVQKDMKWYKRQHMKRIENDANQYIFRNKVKRKQYIRSRKQEFDDFYRCYTDEKWLFEQSQEVVRLDSAVQGYLSLSSTNRSTLMWSHYAQNHEGFVVGFDGEHEYFEYGVVNVDYKDQRPYLDPTQSRQDASLFYTKSTDWRYEQEYRKSMAFIESVKLGNGNSMLPFPDEAPREGDECLKVVRLYDYPKECVSSIIVGWKSPPKLLSDIKMIIKDHQMYEVKLFRAIPHKFKYEMEIHAV